VYASPPVISATLRSSARSGGTRCRIPSISMKPESVPKVIV
jgi:hypothetical protein